MAQQQQQQQQQSTKCSTKDASSSTGISTSKSKSSVPVYKPRPAEAVLKKDDIGRIIDLGLGRGVDATDPKPWLNKTSFQVRKVIMENIIGTEEGGALQSYEREITSVYTQQAQLKTSVTVPQSPVPIGVDAELSRSHSTTRRVVGKRVINRTISFRADFEDVPLSSEKHPEKARVESSSIPETYTTSEEDSKSSIGDPQSKLTFEERLAKWILERLLIKLEMEGVKLAAKGSSIPQQKIETLKLGDLNAVAHLDKAIQNSTEEDRKEIMKACQDFVHYFHITHYASSIELGASEYRVLSESEYYSQIGAGGTFGIDPLANTAVSGKLTWKKTRKISDLKQIGKIYKEAVERGSYDEAVVGVDVQPITRLVKLRYLRLALQKAIVEYMDERGDVSVGPFLIACNNDSIFWSVKPDADYAIEATRNIKNASIFYVIPSDDGIHPYEFIIGFYGDTRKGLDRSRRALTLSSGLTVKPIPRYLCAPANVCGVNPGPLHLKFAVNQSDSRLTLHSRLIKGYRPVDTRAWISGHEAFYINCARRLLKIDGYICVKLQPDGRLLTARVPFRRYHNEHSIWMLFRLLPASLRDNPTSHVTGMPGKARHISAELQEHEEVYAIQHSLQEEKYLHSAEPEDTTKLLDTPPVTDTSL